MSHIPSQPEQSDLTEIELLRALDDLAVSGSSQAIRKTSSSTFANVDFDPLGNATWGSITGTIANQTDLFSNFVTYAGAISDVDLGSYDITSTGTATFSGVIIPEVFTVMKEPTGFENRTTSDWTFADGTRTLTFTPSSDCYIWFHGVRKAITESKTITITDVEGEHAIYFDTDLTLKEYVNTSTANMLTVMRDKCLVAIIYWDATNNVSVYQGEERHGAVMDGQTHYYLHYTRGLQYVDGLGLGDFVIGNGSLDTHAQFSVAIGSIADEDIGLTVSAITSTTGLPILYRNGASGDWRLATQAGFSVYKNPSGTTNRLMYNQFTGGSWQLTEIGEGNYVLCHIFATTGKTNQIVALMGQAEYTTSVAARAGVQDEISDLLLGDLPTPEIRPIASVIFQTDKDYGNTINARVIEVTLGGDDYVDWRSNELPRGTIPADHGSLTGLSDDDHTQYLLINGTRAMTGTLDMGSNNITTTGTISGINVTSGTDPGHLHSIYVTEPIAIAYAVAL